ncbi:hypothetical protein HJFPF1_03330 [Paramyrothecium foliicola]|nr:hypothetical protein HJFPF1_03330 [Paramyrothecium foliicola]
MLWTPGSMRCDYLQGRGFVLHTRGPESTCNTDCDLGNVNALFWVCVGGRMLRFARRHNSLARTVELLKGVKGTMSGATRLGATPSAVLHMGPSLDLRSRWCLRRLVQRFSAATGWSESPEKG